MLKSASTLGMSNDEASGSLGVVGSLEWSF